MPSAEKLKIGSWLDPGADEVVHRRPYDFGEAKAAHARAARDATAAESFTAQCSDEYADAEKAYREALAKKMVELHNEGKAWTVVENLAKGDSQVADLKRQRDIAEGLKKAAEQMSWKVNANRRALEQLVDWSQRVNLGGEQ